MKEKGAWLFENNHFGDNGLTSIWPPVVKKNYPYRSEVCTE